MTDRLPPNDPAMERAVLGCILQNPSVADECASRFKVGAEVFFDLRHKRLYQVLVGMREQNIPIDSATVFSTLSRAQILNEVGGVAYLSGHVDDAVASNFEFYADALSECYMLRQASSACVSAVADVYDNQASADEVIIGIETKLASIRESRGTDDIVSAHKAANLLSDHLEVRYKLEGAKSGIVTGLHSFDAITDGLQYGELSIIGARPSQGKTALATTIVHRACICDGLPTLFITLEMSIAALCRRILSRHCRFGMKELKSGRFSGSDFGQFSAFNIKLANSPLYFMDSVGGNNVSRIVACIRRAVKSNGIKLVVVDYLQKIHASGKHEKRTYEVAEVSTALKAVAVELGVAMLALAQLNREPEKDKKRLPRISDLADSSQIERDADLISLLHRNTAENFGREAWLIVAKQRDGEIGNCKLHFEGKYASFENSGPEENEL